MLRDLKEVRCSATRDLSSNVAYKLQSRSLPPPHIGPHIGSMYRIGSVHRCQKCHAQTTTSPNNLTTPLHIKGWDCVPVIVVDWIEVKLGKHGCKSTSNECLEKGDSNCRKYGLS